MSDALTNLNEGGEQRSPEESCNPPAIPSTPVFTLRRCTGFLTLLLLVSAVALWTNYLTEGDTDKILTSTGLAALVAAGGIAMKAVPDSVQKSVIDAIWAFFDSWDATIIFAALLFFAFIAAGFFGSVKIELPKDDKSGASVYIFDKLPFDLKSGSESRVSWTDQKNVFVRRTALWGSSSYYVKVEGHPYREIKIGAYRKATVDTNLPATRAVILLAPDCDVFRDIAGNGDHPEKVNIHLGTENPVAVDYKAQFIWIGAMSDVQIPSETARAITDHNGLCWVAGDIAKDRIAGLPVSLDDREFEVTNMKPAFDRKYWVEPGEGYNGFIQLWWVKHVDKNR
jgi:hypothetical protein